METKDVIAKLKKVQGKDADVTALITQIGNYVVTVEEAVDKNMKYLQKISMLLKTPKVHQGKVVDKGIVAEIRKYNGTSFDKLRQVSHNLEEFKFFLEEFIEGIA